MPAGKPSAAAAAVRRERPAAVVAGNRQGSCSSSSPSRASISGSAASARDCRAWRWPARSGRGHGVRRAGRRSRRPRNRCGWGVAATAGDSLRRRRIWPMATALAPWPMSLGEEIAAQFGRERGIVRLPRESSQLMTRPRGLSSRVENLHRPALARNADGQNRSRNRLADGCLPNRRSARPARSGRCPARRRRRPCNIVRPARSRPTAMRPPAIDDDGLDVGRSQVEPEIHGLHLAVVGVEQLGGEFDARPGIAETDRVVMRTAGQRVARQPARARRRAARSCSAATGNAGSGPKS